MRRRISQYLWGFWTRLYVYEQTAGLMGHRWRARLWGLAQRLVLRLAVWSGLPV